MERKDHMYLRKDHRYLRKEKTIGMYGRQKELREAFHQLFLHRLVKKEGVTVSVKETRE